MLLVTSDCGERTARSFGFGPFLLIPERQLLLNGEVPVRIGGRALDILTALVERPGEIVSKQELFARVWPNTIVEEANLKVNMNALRRALGDGPEPAKYIATVTGRGYRFIAQVQAAEEGISAGTATGGQGLPMAVARIFGRADVIDAILHDLNVSKIVSVVGTGGVGKTTVAVAAAHEASRQRAYGATFVDLAKISDPQFVPTAIAYALGLGVTGGDPLSSVLRALKLQEKILLFDNCEHLLPSVAIAVDRLARQLDGVRILTTSREPLGLGGAERIHRIRGLECDPSERPAADEACKFPAVELFATRATERSGYRLTDADAAAVAEICRRLDGNALAIELAATQTAAFSPARILQMLDESFRLLNLGPLGAPQRQQSLLATLDWSYSLLSEREAALLCEVSVFAGVFSVDGAAAVSNGGPAEAMDTLAKLAAKSLLVMDTDADLVSYRLLETTRSYCAERLRISGEDQAVRCRHAEHVCAVLEQAASEWSQRPAHEWGAAYRHVVDDLRVALAWARRDEANRSLRIRLTVAGLLLWNHFSLIQECHVHVSRAVEELDAAGLAGTAFEMKFKLWLGASTMITRGLKPAAMAALRRASEIANRIGDTDYRHRCLMLIAAFELFTGEYDSGIRTIKTFASVAAADDPSILPEGEVHLGIADLFLGRLQDAQHRLESLRQRDLRYFNRSYSVRYLADIVILLECALSQVLWLRGLPDSASRTAAAAFERARPGHHHLSLNNALTYSCPVFFWCGRYEECDQYVELLAEHVDRQGLFTRRPIASFYRAALAHEKGDASSDTIDSLKEAIEEFRNVNYLVRMPYYLSVLADALARAGRFGEAEATILTAVKTARARSEGWCLPEIIRVHAFILAAQDQTREAEASLMESIQLARDIGALSWRLRAANDLAKLWCARSRRDDARKMLLPIYDEFTEGFQTRDLLVASDLLAKLATSGDGRAA
ncbi:winged helix-turn-helix domain-containing protein [Bradyrhizobium tunisiense]|uniref:winged helix-turn-helix domain-containing protein n=1 Tax=Bradyrhizobium tunisiense TaxID=3278709 RepID=UPI0035DE9228